MNKQSLKTIFISIQKAEGLYTEPVSNIDVEKGRDFGYCEKEFEENQ